MREGSEPEVFLYGAPSSLYTAKVRAFLRAHRIPYEERFPSHPRYRGAVREAAESHRIPVVEFPDHTVVQDSTLILDELERRYRPAAHLALGPRQQLASHLLECVGDRGLTKPAMHFRWNFMEVNEAFILGEFGRALRFPGPAEEIERLGRRVAAKMSGYLPMLGIGPDTAPAIEAAYAETLASLNALFAEQPYVLGGAPTRGDFALMGPMYGHLGRDPYPLRLMQTSAPLVFRWIERINGGEGPLPEFPDAPDGPLADDVVPEALKGFLRHVFTTYRDELLASAERLAGWVAEHGDAAAGTLLSPAGVDQPVLGPIVVDYHGVRVQQQAMGHSLWVLQRALDFMAALDAEARQSCEALADEVGVGALLRLKLARRLTRIGGRLAVA